MVPGVSFRTQLCCAAALVWLACFQGLQAQQTSVGPAALMPVPRLVWFNGSFQPADGQPVAAAETVTLAVYADPQGGDALWQETQNVVVGRDGRYNLLMGSTSVEGLPLDLFTTGDPRWLGVRFNRSGEVEQPRVHLASVAYALKAADADTLGGKPASAFVLAEPLSPGATTTAGGQAATAQRADAEAGTAQSSGTAGYIGKFVNTTDLGNSAMYQSGNFVGVGTTTPLDAMHVSFTDAGGQFTGYAVQNRSAGAAAYAGMLFYDQNGAVAQFQGFNNASHEYRINNVALSGSINFMLGSTSRFLVANAGIGIGTTAPNALLDVSNALVPTSAIANIAATSYGANNFGSEIFGRKARGTAAAPSAVLGGDALAIWGGKGYGATGFSTISSGVAMLAAENWTDTAQGSIMNFSTTPNGTTGPINRMTIGSNGNVGIGVCCAQANVEVSSGQTDAPAVIMATTYSSGGGGSIFNGRRARGTSVAPSAVLSGDILANFSGRGYGATGFNFAGGIGGMGVNAAENWTDTAEGTKINFFTTPTGTTGAQIRMTIDPSGNVGIGTQAPSIPLEVTRTGTDVGVGSTVYTNGADVGSFLVTQTARGTAAAPTAVQTGDFLGAVLISGYATTRFKEAAAVAAVAAENFTDTARGTALGLATTPLGGNDSVLGLTLLPSGNVGIGTPVDANGIPTATDKLQVFGDVRVGTSGTNGCIKNFAGTGIIGTCASDRRFKKNITPFGSVLGSLTALQPVHYYWRAADFPGQHFGDSQAYGLIAQDVEQVLPELVVTNDDGYKAIDYSKLPLLTIQAVKELKTENDALKAQNDALKNRVAEIERVIEALRATSPRR